MGDSRTIMIRIGADGRAAVVETEKTVNGMRQHLDNAGGSADILSKKFSAIAVPTASIISVYALGSAVRTVTSESLRYLGQLETSGLGIATSFMTGGKYIDQTSGKVLQGSAALKAAQADSTRTMEQLQVVNMQTIATLDQLVRAYQETLPVAMAKGFNRDQVLQFTTAMVQAAGAIGLRMDQLGEETRSILTGAIDPRTSRVATVLGLRNEDIKEHSKNAQQLFDFLMQKLDAYKVAGIASQKTWDGLWSNTKDIALQAGGQTFQPLFDQIKYELVQITSHMVTVDDATKKINWNPDFVSGVQSLRSGVNAVVAEVYRLGMLIDLAGGSMTAFGARTLKVAELVTRFVTIGQFGDGLKKGSEQMTQWNKMLEGRYKSKDKALLAMAYREAGLDENGDPIAKPGNADYQQNAPKDDKKQKEKEQRAADRAAKTARDISMIIEASRERDLMIGKQKDEKELLQLDLKHKQEIHRLTDLHASKAKIAELAAMQEKEKSDLLAKQKEERDYRAAQSSAKIAEAEFQAKSQWLTKLEDFQVRTGQLDEGTALDNRYQRERDLLVLKQQSLEVEIDHEKEQSKRNELAAEYWRISEQIEQSEIAQGYERLNLEKRLRESRQAALESELALRMSTIHTQEAQGLLKAVDAQKRQLEILKQQAVIKQELLQTMPKSTSEEITAWSQQAAAIEDVNRQIATLQKNLRLREPLEGMKQGFEDYADSAMNLGAQIQAATQNSFKGMEDSLLNFVKTGKLSFTDMANSIINDLIRIAIRASITGPIASAIGGMFGNFFGGTAAKTASSSVGGGLGAGAADFFHDGGLVSKFHDGGLIIPRFHFGGLASDEVPAVLQTGERVLDREHNALLERFANKADSYGGTPNVEVNVINRSSGQATSSANNVRFDAKGMIIDVFIDDYMSNGRTRKLLTAGGGGGF